MSNKQTQWITTSNVWYQRILALVLITLGVVFITNTEFSTYWNNERSAYLLGFILLIVGAGAFLVAATEVTLVDPTKRVIIIEENLFGKLKKQTIPFDAIARIQIGHLGRTTSGVRFYHLNLMLRNNKQVALFSPGKFYPGCFERSTIERYQQKLDTMVNAD